MEFYSFHVPAFHIYFSGILRYKEKIEKALDLNDQEPKDEKMLYKY